MHELEKELNVVPLLKEVEIKEKIAARAGNYTPSFYNSGKAELLKSSYGLGVFTQNRNYFFASCNRGVKERAFVVLPQVARKIIKEMDNHKSIVQELWGGPNKDYLEVLARIEDEVLLL